MDFKCEVCRSVYDVPRFIARPSRVLNTTTLLFLLSAVSFGIVFKEREVGCSDSIYWKGWFCSLGLAVFLRNFVE